QIRRHQFRPRLAREQLQASRVDIDGGDGMAPGQEQAAVAPAATGHIKHCPAGHHCRRETRDPGVGSSRFPAHVLFSGAADAAAAASCTTVLKTGWMWI